jgi:hypothetical protein
LAEYKKDNENASPEENAEFLRNIVKDVRELINNNPTKKINDLFKVTMPANVSDATRVIKVLPTEKQNSNQKKEEKNKTMAASIVNKEWL